MKRAISIVMVFFLIFSLSACGQVSENGNQTEPSSSGSLQTEPSDTVGAQQSEAEQTGASASVEEGKTLIVYFSWSSSGNTEKMATAIKERTGGDILEIEPLNPYPTDYNECGDVAREERDQNARPEIANLPDSIEEYDTLFIGYPIWWHTAPMIIGTFLENYDLTGKEIYPFTQSASMDTEQFDSSIEFVRENANGATVHDGLFARPSDTAAIDAYLSENGITE